MVVATSAAGAGWLLRDPLPHFLARRSTLATVQVGAVTTEGAYRLASVHLGATSGLAVDLMLRRAIVDSERRLPLVVLLGGHHTGREAARLLEDTRGTTVAAVSYPFTGDPRPDAATFLREIPRIRGAFLDTPPAIMLALDYLLRRPDVDTTRAAAAQCNPRALPCRQRPEGDRVDARRARARRHRDDPAVGRSGARSCTCVSVSHSRGAMLARAGDGGDIRPVTTPTPTSPATGALDAILKPRTISVVGASRAPNTIGHQIVANLVQRGFTGAVYPVNPKAHAVCAIPAWPSVSALPAPIDVAVVAVPKEHVIAVAEECGAAGVKSLVVISAGFREVGGEGIERERRLLEVTRRHGMRMVGPNCMGMINTDPAYSMNATFVQPMPPFGPAAFVSQSGAIGANVLDYATEYGIGIAQFVSMGNKPDVSGNDLLLQWEHDPQVGVILMYAENFGNPRRFLEIASRITRTKPIIVVKAGRSAVGARAASSHTGALAASDSAVEALMQQAGVLRAGSIEELFDMAMAFSVLRPPRGRRTGVVTNSGGPGVLAADALEEQGLDLVEFQPDTVARIAPLFPAEASIRNPLDMIASANAAGYRVALDAILSDANVDAAVAIFTPPLGVRTADVSEAIGAVAMAHRDKPVLAVLLGREGLPQGKRELLQSGVPAYIFAESAARSLGALVRYGARMARPPRAVPDAATLGVDARCVRSIIDAATARGERKLNELEALAVIEAYGIPTVGARVARTAEQAAQFAEQLGDGPVVLKIVSPQVIHKTDVGGVRLGVDGPEAVRRAFDEIVANVRRAVPNAEIEGVLVQRQLAAGRELIAGITRQPGFGALVMVGLGGVLVEVLRDVTFRIAPVDAHEAEDMLAGLRSTRILGALRGMPAVDRAKLADVLVRVARLGADFPRIEELDINPLLLSADGGVAVDARILLTEG